MSDVCKLARTGKPLDLKIFLFFVNLSSTFERAPV